MPCLVLSFCRYHYVFALDMIRGGTFYHYYFMSVHLRIVHAAYFDSYLGYAVLLYHSRSHRYAGKYAGARCFPSAHAAAGMVMHWIRFIRICGREPISRRRLCITANNPIKPARLLLGCAGFGLDRKRPERVAYAGLLPLGSLVPARAAIWHGWRGQPNAERLDRFFADRCFPPTRQNASELLHMLGLSLYQPKLICRKTHGVVAHDHFWIHYDDDPEEISYAELIHQMAQAVHVKEI